MNEYKFSDVVEIISGGTPKTDVKEYWNGDIDWLSIVDFGSSNKYVYQAEKKITNLGLVNSSTKLLEKDDIIISARGTVGAMAMLNKPMAFNQSCFGLRGKQEYLNQEYLFYYLKFYMSSIKAKKQGSVFDTINLSTFDMLQINIANFENQSKLVKILSSIDSKIELNNKIMQELEDFVHTLYVYWFLQFDFPNEEGKPYKSSGGKMFYNEELKRDIPISWKFESLNKNIELIIDHRGKTPLKLGGDWVDNGVVALSAKIVKGGKLINLDQANQVSKEMYEKWMPIKLQDGDILMTSEAPLGEFYYVLLDTEYCLSQRLYAIRADIKKVEPSYLYYELSVGHGYSQIMGSSSGSTVFGIRQDELRKIKIVVPDMRVQKTFEKIVQPMLCKIKKLDTEIRELKQLRDWLLPMLMNGQVTFNE